MTTLTSSLSRPLPLFLLPSWGQVGSHGVPHQVPLPRTHTRLGSDPTLQALPMFNTAQILPTLSRGPAHTLEALSLDCEGTTPHHLHRPHRATAPFPQVYLIPGDTFRAAASEQLAEWARRSNAVMGSFVEGARPMTVISQVRVWLGILMGSGRLAAAWASRGGEPG